MNARFAILAALLPVTWQAPYQFSLNDIPRYKPEQRVRGTIRLWGHGSPTHDFMGKLVRAWEQGFSKYQPDVMFEYRMYGTASSIGALYTGVGNLAIRGEEIHDFEISAFERVLHYSPLEIDIATGSLDVRNMDFAQVFFVHWDNPISKLTLAQLDGIFGYEHRRGLGDIRFWGQLGLTGEWAAKQINIYGWDVNDDFADYLEQTVLKGSHQWKCNLIGFKHIRLPNGSIYDSGKQILDALANDRYGIAVSNLRYANPQVKPVALAFDSRSPYYEATKANLIEQKYPLTRIVPAYVNCPPRGQVEAPVREFLRYILSQEGQAAIIRESGYLPLNPRAIQEQLRKLH